MMAQMVKSCIQGVHLTFFLLCLLKTSNLLSQKKHLKELMKMAIFSCVFKTVDIFAPYSTPPEGDRSSHQRCGFYPSMVWRKAFLSHESFQDDDFWRGVPTNWCILVQEISKRTVPEQTPKPDNLIAQSQFTERGPSVRSQSIFHGIMDGPPTP